MTWAAIATLLGIEGYDSYSREHWDTLIDAMLRAGMINLAAVYRLRRVAPSNPMWVPSDEALYSPFFRKLCWGKP